MNNISWEKYFVSLVKVNASKSKDPNTKVGAIIVNNDNKVISMGYNCMPLDHDQFPWDREAAKQIDTKYPYVIHAEINAILNASESTKGSSIYVSLFPCSYCAKTLVQAGVKKIFYIDDKYHNTEDAEIARKIFKDLKIETIQINNID